MAKYETRDGKFSPALAIEDAFDGGLVYQNGQYHIDYDNDAAFKKTLKSTTRYYSTEYVDIHSDIQNPPDITEINLSAAYQELSERARTLGYEENDERAEYGDQKPNAHYILLEEAKRILAKNSVIVDTDADVLTEAFLTGKKEQIYRARSGGIYNSTRYQKFKTAMDAHQPTALREFAEDVDEFLPAYNKDHPDLIRREATRVSKYWGMIGQYFNPIYELIEKQYLCETVEEALLLYPTIAEQFLDMSGRRVYPKIDNYFASKIIKPNSDNALEKIFTLRTLLNEKARRADKEEYAPTVERIKSLQAKFSEFPEVLLTLKKFEHLDLPDPEWIIDELGITSAEQTLKFVQLWDSLGKRYTQSPSAAKRFNFILNQFPNSPLWFQRQALVLQLTSPELADSKEMLAAVRGLEESKLIWEKDAAHIARLPEWQRIVAAGIINDIAKQNNVTIEYSRNSESIQYNGNYDRELADYMGINAQ